MTATARDLEAIRLGDERAEAGDWVEAVGRWRAAMGEGATGEREAAEGRLRAFVGHFDPGGAARVPRRALRPLAVCAETALLGVLTVVLGNAVEGGPDAVLLWAGWGCFAVSAGAAVVFAARSGRLDGPDPSETADLPEIAARADAVAARLAAAPAGSGGAAADEGEGRA